MAPPKWTKIEICGMQIPPSGNPDQKYCVDIFLKATIYPGGIRSHDP
jgi:hypothetical protein